MKKTGFLSYTTKLFLRMFLLSIGCVITSAFIARFINFTMIRSVAAYAFLLLILPLIFSFSWDMGQADNEKAIKNNSRTNIFKGLMAGLIASVPFFISGILLILSKLELFSYGYFRIYKLINSFYFPINHTLLPNELLISEISWGSLLISVSLLLIVPVISMFGYMLGDKHYSITSVLIYKKKKTE
ncbi:MAG: hypothetical protein BGN88_12900 [Clostridiales bacterium 43-6]|nr:MAG: hypothetical protein BGN88_12900 [Clostridiales bacterium 43-6]